MEKIIRNPGLQHIIEQVFLNLDVEDLKNCGQINESCKKIVENPMIWLKKHRSLSKENLKDWIKIIKQVKNSVKQNAIISYLQWNLEKGVLNLPCYCNPDIQDNFRKKIWKICEDDEPSDEDIETVKILAPLTDNPNARGRNRGTPILWAATFGHTEIVKILVPFTDNPNARDKHGMTPISAAASCGFTEIVKILVPLTDNPNAHNIFGNTPIYWAAKHGYTEIVQILAPLTDNPNTPTNTGNTPILRAAKNGHTEIVKILAPLTENPNAPNKKGQTPIQEAAERGHIEIVKILTPLTDNHNTQNEDVNKNEDDWEDYSGDDSEDDSEDDIIEDDVCLSCGQTCVDHYIFGPCGHHPFCNICQESNPTCTVCDEYVIHRIKMIFPS